MCLIPDQCQHSLGGGSGGRRHDDQWLTKQQQLPEQLQVDQHRLETSAQVTTSHDDVTRGLAETGRQSRDTPEEVQLVKGGQHSGRWQEVLKGSSISSEDDYQHQVL